VLDKPTNQITRLNQIPSTILSTRLLTRLMEDRDGFVWIGTSEKGVNRMNPATSQFDHFYEIPGDTASISGNYVESIFQDSDGNIWIGTDKALNRFNQQTKTFARYALFDEFNPGPIKAIKEDGNKNLWISTANGLARFNRETGDVVHLNGLNGLQDNTFSNGATKLHDGRLVFGGLNGVTVFDPEAIIPDKSFPKILIENAKINDSIRFVDFSEQDSLFLSHSQNNISFTLGTSEYFSPELIKFRYRLKGFETLWSNTTIKNNQIKYNNLKPGHYILEITSTNGYGKWNPTLQTCYIQIKKPWWSTWWFMVLSVFTFAGFIVVVVRVREKNLKEAKRKLEKKVKERTIELAESVEKLQLSEANLAEAVAAKDKFFSIIAHDLKNPVLALQHISDKLVTEYGKLSTQQQAELLSSMNRQIHLTYSFLDNLLLWSLSQKNAIAFHPKAIRLNDIISEVIVLLDENARLKSIEIGCSVSETLFVYADKNMVFIILNNLVNNAVKFSYPNSKVHIEAIDEGENLKISVKDNGIGIPQEQIPKLFTITSKFRTMGTQKESGTGTGLLICKEFVEKNGGKISVKSIQDSESIFYFTLPKANHQ
jgi:signal transduction histidine kinase